jgi:hypothetical protein
MNAIQVANNSAQEMDRNVGCSDCCREDSQISLRRAFFLVASVSPSTFGKSNEPNSQPFFYPTRMILPQDVGG